MALSSFLILVGVVLAAGLVSIVIGVATSGRPRPDRVDGGAAASGAFGELVEVFQPSRVNLTEELERKRHDVQQAPGTAPGTVIDLEQGIAVLRAEPVAAPPPTPASGLKPAVDPDSRGHR